MNGSTTPSVAPMATAASTASPPAWRVSRPAWVASGWFDATAPRRPMMTGRYDRGPSKATILVPSQSVAGGLAVDMIAGPWAASSYGTGSGTAAGKLTVKVEPWP